VNCAGGKSSWLAEWSNAADGSFGVAPWAPKPGDNLSLRVGENSGTIKFKIADHTLGKSFAGTASASNMVLLEAPCFTDMLTNTTSGTVFPQVRFGTAVFGQCLAAVSGKTKAIWGFNTAYLKIEWITYNAHGAVALNKVGKIQDKENFNVTFVNAGP
jgi:hypothetical protein